MRTTRARKALAKIKGLKFTDCQEFFFEKQAACEAATIQTAKENYHSEGEIEIDRDAIVSRARNGFGAYVQAWVWVPDED